MEKITKILASAGEKVTLDQYVLALTEYVGTQSSYDRLSMLPHCYLPETDECHLKIVQEGYTVLGGDPYQPWRENALFYATEMDHTMTVVYLLDMGTYPNCCFGYPVTFACSEGNIDIARAYIKHLPKNQIDMGIVNPVVVNGRLDVFQLLIPKSHTWDNFLPKGQVLDWIICCRKLRILRYVIESFYLSVEEYYACFRMAVSVGCMDVLKVLRSYDVASFHSNTIRELVGSAVIHNRWTVLCYLLEAYKGDKDLAAYARPKRTKEERDTYYLYFIERAHLVEMVYEDFMAILVNFLKGRLAPCDFEEFASDYLFDGNIGLILAEYIE